MEHLEQYLASLNIPEAEREHVRAALSSYLEEIALDTLVHNLSDEQRKRFDIALDKGGSDMEVAIEQIIGESPELAQIMDEAIKNELAAISVSKQILDDKT